MTVSPLETEYPQRQYLDSSLVIDELADVGRRSVLRRSTAELLVMATMAGAFITAGAFFSVLITADIENASVRLLLDGFGFSTGFFMVILSGALLFTEANVELPATLLGHTMVSRVRIARMWAIAGVGNFLGALLVGLAITIANKEPDPEVAMRLSEIAATKAGFREVGGVEGWIRAVISGVLGNWLVGMAAFLSLMGRTIIGRYIPAVLVVTMFVASGFLHSPANMAFVSLSELSGNGVGWGDALWWAIAPAAIGNILGGMLLVAVPYAYLSWHGASRGRSDPPLAVNNSHAARWRTSSAKERCSY